MAAARPNASNSLVVRGSGAVTVQLHPLVLLSISDHITRHALRGHQRPLLGAVIGQQNGREVTLEHAYHCRVARAAADKSSGGSNDDLTGAPVSLAAAQLDGDWFRERLEMYKEVHKAPQLDLTAFYMLAPASGPTADHRRLLQQVHELTGLDGTLLLLCHPELVDELEGGKLPFSLYEPVVEAVDGKTEMRFRELPYDIETGEAEMISVDFVAKGAANATASAPAPATEQGKGKKPSKSKAKAKEKETENTEEGDGAEAAAAPPTNYLSPEDEELISTLNAKVNAIKMLDERLNLLRAYLEGLPKSYLTEASSSAVPEPASSESEVETNHVLLRHIQSLLSRLPLLSPPTPSTSSPTSDAAAAAQAQKDSVHLTSLLTTLTQSLASAQTLSGKMDVVRRERATRERRRGPGGIGGMGWGLGMMAEG